MEENKSPYDEQHKRGRVLSGIILILVGALIFARKLGMIFPDWLFSWPMFLIALGVYIGAKHNFRNPGWLIPTGIGTFFLMETFYPDFRIHEFFWPVILIAIGVFVIVKPKRYKHRHWRENIEAGYDERGMRNDCMPPGEINDNKIDITAVMGGVRKIVISKDFKGGEINTVMGGAEINLTQADIQGRAILEINNIFGGTKLYVPSNWEVISDAMVILGGVEDKRQMIPGSNPNPDKMLVIQGACVFGGIEIKSFS